MISCSPTELITLISAALTTLACDNSIVAANPAAVSMIEFFMTLLLGYALVYNVGADRIRLHKRESIFYIVRGRFETWRDCLPKQRILW